MSQSKFWCFTLNNPTAADEARISVFFSSRFVTYGVYGREIGESGTPHLQGYLILNRARRLSYLRNHVSDRAHFEIARGSPQQASDYCKKDGDFVEEGDLPESRQGRRSDLDDGIDWIKEFVADNGRAPSSPEIAKLQPKLYVKYYHRIVSLAAHLGPQRRLEFGEPREWQRNLADDLMNDADDRSIRFVIDPTGGKGKTWFCRWMLTNNAAVQVLGVGKKDDIAHMLDTTKTIFLFNVARGQMEYLSYPLLESLKDRMVMSPKYNSMMKTWDGTVHVVVLGNEMPDESKLTADRYTYVDID